MHCWNIRALLPLLALLLHPVDRLLAQGGDDSPYSSFGFGDLLGTAQPGQALMGGTGIALVEHNSAIQANPAAYAGMRWPHVEVGGVGRFVQLSSEGTTTTRDNARLLGISIGVPFGSVKAGDHRWGLAVGIQPVSEVGYLLEEHATLGGGGDVRFEYTGNGGINRAFAGLGWAVWQRRDSLGSGSRLTIGANFNYLFGSVEQLRKAYYPIGVGYYNTSLFSALVMSAPGANVGTQYSADLVSKDTMERILMRKTERRARRISEWNSTRPDSLHRTDPRKPRTSEAWRFTIGIAAEASGTLRAHQTDLGTTFIVANNVELLRDTIAYNSDVPGKIFLPPAFGLGVSVHNSHWTVCAETRMRDWEDLRVEVDGYDLASTLATSITYAMGASWHPAGDRGVGSFAERSTWRFGLRYADDYIVVKEKQLSEMAISLGASLPLLGSQSRSRVTLGVELGQRGTETDGLILERFADVYIGFTLTPELRQSRWFKKRQIE